MIVHQGTQTNLKPDVYDVLMGEFDAAECPLYNRLKKGPDVPDATLFQWPFDVPDNPSNAGSVEGRRFAQANAVTYGGPDLMYGRMHYHKEEFGVGEVAQGNQQFAMQGAKPFEYQMKRALRKCMKSAEYTIVGGQESQAGSNAAAFRTRGLERLIQPTGNIAVQTDSGTVIPSAFRPSAAQCVDLELTDDDYTLLEANLTAPFQAIYNALKSKIDLDVFGTTTFKGKVSAFSRVTPTEQGMTVVRRFNNEAGDMKVVAVVDTYVGDCGTARIDLHPWVQHDPETQTAEAFGLDLRYGQLRMRTAPSVAQLPDQAAGKEGYVQHMFGLQMTPKFQARWNRVDNVEDSPSPSPSPSPSGS